MPNDLEWLLEGYAFVSAQEALEIRNLQRSIEEMAGEVPYGFVDVVHLTPEQGMMIIDELRETERLLRKALRKRNAGRSGRSG